MRLTTALGALLMAACHPAATPAPASGRCEPTVPPAAQHPIATRTASLAGHYDLIQVQTQPAGGVVMAARLHLAPLDSVSRAAAAGGAVRDLTGSLERERGARGEVVEAVLAGQHLRLGRPGDPDDVVQHLTITAVAPDGFWGWWKADRGIAVAADPGTGRVAPDPAGYFCALRRDPAR
jgi:hypothetical protein